MRSKSILEIILQTFLFLVGACITYFFWKNSLLLTGIYLAILLAIFLVNYQQGDFFAFCYGAVLGFAIEVFATDITHLHTFANADFFGMPMWMPIVWGSFSLLMKRIGIIIYKDAQPETGKHK